MATRVEPANLLVDLSPVGTSEVFTALLARRGCRVERIVSHGQGTPHDQPYRQGWDEWVLLLAGSARLEIEGVEMALAAGDHLLIPAGASHRVTFTDPVRATVWLALHFDGSPDA